MDKVQSVPRGYPHTFSLHAPLNFSMTIKESFFNHHHHHGEFASTDRTNDPWTGSQQNGLNEPSSTPGDLVSLAWLQKGDIIQIAPLDGEDDHQNCFENSTASLSSGRSDDFLPNRQNPVIEEHREFPSFAVRPSAQTELHTMNNTSNLGVQRPASVDNEHYTSTCVVDSPHLLNNHQLGFNGQGLAKPNYSYTHLIFMAIESTPQKCMTVNQIYNWCETNFPFYKHAGAGWKNSLRHNLSINKSFKRLPRDSRGPGRGAFWTVEPRERPTLLDAIKRNPWNFANMAALVSGQTDQNPAFNMFGMRRFGLTQSAPSQVLRTAGLGNGELMEPHTDNLGNLIHLHSGGVRLVPTSNGRLVAACDGRLPQLDVSPSNLEGDTTSASPSASLVLPDSRYWHSPDASASDVGAKVEIEWSAEDEEKYAQTLQLLMESGDHGSRESHTELTCSNRQDSSKLQVNEGMHGDEGKLGTKQRRKSRLQPTRIVEDNYPYTSGLLGKCNECKENAAAGCESCLAKRRRFLSDPLQIASGDDRDFTDVANSLDSDQECGPAGGPTVRKHNSTSTPNRDAPDKTESVAVRQPQQHDDASDEVYVTPAPYIDHEYSHCHAQLRRPEEIRLVNRFNELYCAEAIKRLSKGRSYSKRFGDIKMRSRAFEPAYDDSDADYDETADDAFSSQDQATYSEDYSDASEDLERDQRSNGLSEASSLRKRRRGSRGVSRTLGPHLVENAFHSRDGPRKRVNKHSSRARGRRRFGAYHSSSTGTGVTRRSKRVIRAPKRPYDDFEDPFMIEGEDAGDFSNTTLTKLDGTYAGVPSDSLSHGSPETPVKLEGEEPLRVPHQRTYRGRRTRKRGRKRGRRPNSLHPLKGNEPDRIIYDHNQSESTSDDEEEKYLRLAHRRQQMDNGLEQDDSSVDSGESPYTRPDFYRRNRRDLLLKNASGSGVMGTDCVRGAPLGLSAVWGQSRWAIAQKFSAQSWPAQCASDQDDAALEELVCGQEANADELEECDVEEVHQTASSKGGERTTVEAAQILLGISQMQSFRRQSGYLSLDSSGTSASLTIEAAETVKDDQARSPSATTPMTDKALTINHRCESSTPNCLSPSTQGT